MLLIAYQRPDSCFKVKISSCLRRDMIIVRDFQGPRRDIGIARPRHLKTSLETSSFGLCPIIYLPSQMLKAQPIFLKFV